MWNDVWNERDGEKNANASRLNSFNIFTSSTCQSIFPILSLRHSTKYTIAGLCIFNKFRRESPFAKLVISGSGQRRRLFGCLAISVLTFIYVRRVHNPPQFFHPIHTILSLCFPLSALSCRSCILLPCLYLSPSLFLLLLSPDILYLCLSRIRAASFSSVFLVPVFFFGLSLFSSHPLPALSRALYLGAVSIRVWNMDNRTTRVY